MTVENSNGLSTSALVMLGIGSATVVGLIAYSALSERPVKASPVIGYGGLDNLPTSRQRRTALLTPNATELGNLNATWSNQFRLDRIPDPELKRLLAEAFELEDEYKHTPPGPERTALQKRIGASDNAMFQRQLQIGREGGRIFIEDNELPTRPGGDVGERVLIQESDGPTYLAQVSSGLKDADIYRVLDLELVHAVPSEGHNFIWFRIDATHPGYTKYSVRDLRGRHTY